MALLKPKVIDGFGGVERTLARGDLLAGGQVVNALDTTATNLTITGAMLAVGLIRRNPGGVCNENIDTATNIINALSQGVGTVGVENGTSFVVYWINASANALTLVAAANTGLTLTDATVLANGVKPVLFVVTNGTPAKTVTAVSSAGSNTILAGFTDAEIAALSPGMIVLNAVVNLQGQTIIGVNRSNNTVTMSASANAATVVSVQFSPKIDIYGLGCTAAR